jgi:phage shock protein PspC (stress-responsive transcriptional regulator)
MVVTREASATSTSVLSSSIVSAPRPGTTSSPACRRSHLAVALGFLLALVPLMGLLTEGTFDPGFRASEDKQALFYDAQARSLLDLRLDVPSEAIGGEGIHVRDRVYAYFGITPALLRIPFMAMYPEGYPNLAPWSYLAAFVLQGLMAVGIWRAVQRRFGMTAPPAFDGLVVFTVLAASPMVLLTARPDVYEEAILWGVTFTLVAFWGVLRLLERPRRLWAGVAVAAAALAVLSRPPVGIASLVAVGVAGVVVFRRNRAAWPLSARLIAGACGGLGAYLALNYMKFRTFINPPYEHHEMFMQQPRRLASLLKYGTNRPENIPTNLLQYLRPDTLHFRAEFPWLTFRMPNHAPVFEVGTVHFDGFEFPVSITAIAPTLLVLAVIGSIVVARRRSVDLAIPIGAGVVAIIATCSFFGSSLRYLGDFMPWLVVGGCAGLAATMMWKPSIAWVKPVLVAAAGVGIVWSVYVTLALGRAYQIKTIK